MGSINNSVPKPPKGTSIKTAAEDITRKYDSPDGGLREIRRRNGVDVDGPPDVRDEFARGLVKRNRSGLTDSQTA